MTYDEHMTYKAKEIIGAAELDIIGRAPIKDDQRSKRMDLTSVASVKWEI